MDDVDAAQAFYSRVLGLDLDSCDGGRHVFFRRGGAMLLLFNPQQTMQPGGIDPPHGAKGAGHVAFTVTAGELPAWRERLHGHGVDTEAEVTWPRGGQSLYVRDPAGNSVELTTPATRKL